MIKNNLQPFNLSSFLNLANWNYYWMIQKYLLFKIWNLLVSDGWPSEWNNSVNYFKFSYLYSKNFWAIVLGKVIHYWTPRHEVGYVIYFKFKPVLFQWMLRLIKELNKLGATGMKIIYWSSCQRNYFFLLKKIWRYQNFVPRLDCWKHKLAQIDFTLSCNLKTRGLEVTMFSELYSVKLVSQEVSSDFDTTV